MGAMIECVKTSCDNYHDGCGYDECEHYAPVGGDEVSMDNDAQRIVRTEPKAATRASVDEPLYWTFCQARSFA